MRKVMILEVPRVRFLREEGVIGECIVLWRRSGVGL